MQIEETKKLDVTKYVGEKTKIAYACVEEGKHGRFIKVESEEIPFKEGDTLPERTGLRASVLLGLVLNEETGEYTIIKDSKAHKFLTAKGVKDKEIAELTGEKGELVACLIGKDVVCQKNEKGYLEIA